MENLLREVQAEREELAITERVLHRLAWITDEAGQYTDQRRRSLVAPRDHAHAHEAGRVWGQTANSWYSRNQGRVTQ
ncbi:hypothetical protein [Streptomyces sp. bgisy027]|uniref:hypothetical protein n=1 Tax=unclassified Streptomyces TaxID=2593676 RepID=UPI003D730967